MKRFARVIVAVFILSFSISAQDSDKVVVKDDVTTRVVLRENASSDSKDKGSLTKGVQAELLGSVTGWYQVRLPGGDEGFVSKRWTRVVSGAPVAASGQSFTVDVVDVGTGLGVVVRGQDFLLIYDAGSNDDVATGDSNRMVAFLKAVVPQATTIDHMILSHPHNDHVALMPDLLQRYQVKQVWDSGALNDICPYRMFIAAVHDEPGVQYHVAAKASGSRDYAFKAKTCDGVGALPEQTISVPVSLINTDVPISLGAGASMTFLHADGDHHANPNDNSLVVRMDLGPAKILFVGDSQAGERADPSTAAKSVEGKLLACCKAALASDVLIVGHHGSMTSSRTAFLDAVMASTFVVSSGPFKYNGVTLPDDAVINELKSRGQLFRTDLDDTACKTSQTKIGPKADGRVGGCDNVRIVVPAAGAIQVNYWRGGQ